NVAPKLPSALSATYNNANQMTTFNGYPLTYDNNGNLLTLTRSCGITNYTWNARNQLTAINGYDDKCQSMTASFKYDALGRRIEKTINGKTINYLYDGLDIIQEIENGTVTANYIRSLNIDEPLARIKSDGSVRYYQQDALGSVIALTDENGTIKTQYKYSPFGDVETIGEQSDNPFQFAGRENDGTGLLYERFRYYSPELHRYISPDPLQFGGGDMNWYVRVHNDPVNLYDPFGLLSCIGGCHPTITYPSPSTPLPPPSPTQPVIKNPPRPSPKKTRSQCYLQAGLEYRYCLRGTSRSFNKCQNPDDNCYTQMQDRLNECLSNAQ
ncbi:MAG: hypothetical protein HY754_15955, partial [Nitrospirae bacterium]|nr:hypothetical protein [Nitrospirota bacterium]